MIRILTVGLAGLAALILAAGGALADDELKAAISAANDALEGAFASGNGEAMSVHYTEDGALLPPGGERVDGREAIAAFWQSFMDSGVTGLRIDTLEVYGGGDTATEVGRFEISNADGPAGDGKFIVYWRAVEGKWLLHRDIWNTDPAEAAPAE